MNRPRVVVTGLGCVTPAGNDVPSTWESLVAGKSAVRTVEMLQAEKCPTTIGAPVRDFHPETLDVHLDVDRLGRGSQFALAAGVEAWRNAGLRTDSRDRSRRGCVIGTGIGDAAETFHQTKAYLSRGVRAVHPLYVTRVMPNAAPAILSVEFGLAGPSFSVASACASGGHALATAVRLLQAGDADLILAGGVEECFSCVINPSAFDSIRALSRRNDEPERASRPFDRTRDGFVLGEGAAMLVLETLAHATKRGARIYAEVAGVGMASDAFHLTAPEPDGQGAVQSMKLALQDAGWSTRDVQYVNVHGTSTPLNDRIETRAIRAVLGRHADGICASSQKSMMGHLIGASAAAAALCTALSIQHGIVTPTINLQQPDPECDLDYVPHRARTLPLKRALVNSFGFGGHCATLAMASYEPSEGT
jgi:3-oxoacyl-[acyl-carrier-protein] synthase II